MLGPPRIHGPTVVHDSGARPKYRHGQVVKYGSKRRLAVVRGIDATSSGEFFYSVESVGRSADVLSIPEYLLHPLVSDVLAAKARR